jgi:hypothetical protein
MEHEWKPYNCNYEKKWYDIKLHDGTIINTCYPNSGWFHNEYLGMFREERVKMFRLSKEHPMGGDQL